MTPAKKMPPKEPKDANGFAADVSGETDPFLVRALARGLAILRLFDVDHRE